MRIAPIFMTIALAGAALAQHNFTPADVEDGGRLFRSNCVGCHGPDGDLVPGIDLGHNKFKHGVTDDDLIKIIRTGIAGTAMPPGNYTEFQAGTIVAYLRAMATAGRAQTSEGDVARGKTLFFGKANCSNCHRVDGQGGRTGPDLSDVGQLRRRVDLEKSLLQPDAEYLPANRHYRVVTKSGDTVTGRLMNLDTFSVQLLDSKDRLRYFAKSDLKEHGFVAKSPMPSYEKTLTPQELADVVAYLGTLKGIGK